MWADPLVERFLKVDCSDEEYYELETWLERKICPSCLSPHDIELEFGRLFDDEHQLVCEYVECKCCNPNCLEEKVFDRNFD